MQTHTHTHTEDMVLSWSFCYSFTQTVCRTLLVVDVIYKSKIPSPCAEKKINPPSKNLTTSVIVTEKFFGTLRLFALCVFTNSSFCNEQFETNMVLLLVAKQ